MRSMSKTRIASLALLGLVLPAMGFAPVARQAATTPLPALRSLSNASAAHVDFDFASSGCFHQTHFLLRFHPGPDARMTVYEESGQPKSWAEVATVRLTPDQVSRLDNLVAFYRKHNGEGGSTTRNTVTVAMFDSTKTAARETFRDAACQVETLADADPRDLKALGLSEVPVLSLLRVVATALQAREDRQQSVPYTQQPREQSDAFRQVRRKEKEAADKALAERLVLTLPGYDTLNRDFKVSGQNIAEYAIKGRALYTDLVARRKRLVETVTWYNPVEDDRPQCDWNQILSLYQTAETLAARHGWIAEWKKAGPRRSLDLNGYGPEPIGEKPKDVAFFIAPAWKHAGLKGEPFCQITLQRLDTTSVEVYFGKEDERALILEAEPQRHRAAATFWLDTVKLNYHPTQAVPQYIVVAPDGTWRRNTRPK